MKPSLTRWAGVAAFAASFVGCSIPFTKTNALDPVAKQAVAPAASSGETTDDILAKLRASKPAPASEAKVPMILASMAKATGAIRDSFKIKPKVTPAIDPVKLDNQPSDPQAVALDLHYRAGMVFEQQNQLSVAAGHYREALRVAPNNPTFIAAYARTQDRLGNFREAEQMFLQAMQRAPTEAMLVHELGQSYQRNGDRAAALTYFQQAVAMQPSNTAYRSSLALACFGAGRKEEAYEQLVAAQGEAMAHYTLACLLEKASLQDGPIHATAVPSSQDEIHWHLQKAVELNPQFTSALQMRQRRSTTWSASVPVQQAGARLPATN